jgi:hypothetical protein
VTTPAEELREAATALREWAKDIPRPDFYLAVADWLDETADWVAAADAPETSPWVTGPLRIARAYMLEAAAPRIIAVERERIAQLAEQEAAHADLQVASDEARIVGAVLRKFATRLRQEVTGLAVAERTLEPDDGTEESGR